MKTIKEFDYNQIRYGGEEKWFFEKDNLWGIMDKNGEVIKEPEYKLLNKYFEGRVAYGESDDRWGYLDENGNVIVSARYALVWDYKNGLARHIGNPGIGFIDKEGKTVIEGKFYEVRDFNEGLARVQVYF